LRVAFAFLFALSAPSWGLSPEANEFMEITKKLEPMQCQKQRLRREIMLAGAERRSADEQKLKAQFRALDKDPKTSSLENRLAALERRMSNGKGGTLDPEDLPAISRQRLEAFYRCE
jgi:hypothetical protein